MKKLKKGNLFRIAQEASKNADIPYVAVLIAWRKVKPFKHMDGERAFEVMLEAMRKYPEWIFA